MKKGRKTAEILGSDDEFNDELPEDGDHERTLILKAAPPSRRVQLIAHGAREIRCYLLLRDQALGRGRGIQRGMDL